MSSESSCRHCHLVLLGQVGAGKSSTGNTILGQKVFHSKKSLKAVTQNVQHVSGTVNGLNVDVYDTPGFLNPDLQSGDVESKCQTLLQLNSSTPTVFLWVISTDRFTEQEKKATELVVSFIGSIHLQNTWIIFTKGDELESNELTIEQYMEDSEDLKELVQKLDDRYLVINNKQDPRNREQAEELVRKIAQTNMSISQNQPINTDQHIQNQQMEHLHIRDDPITQVTPTPKSEVNTNLPLRKILLLGKTGVGKSATGNTILGNEVFQSKKDVNAVTTESSVKKSNVDGRKVSVIDTPGFFDTKLDEDYLAKEFGRSLCQAEGEVHAFLLIFEYNRFTKQEADVLSRVEAVFGKHVTKHIIIVFTHGDEFDREKLELGIPKNNFLSDVINKCGGRYHIINNRDLQNRDQVIQLLQMIDSMVQPIKGGCYTNEMLKIANMGNFEYFWHIFKEFLKWAMQIFKGSRSSLDDEERPNDTPTVPLLS